MSKKRATRATRATRKAQSMRTSAVLSPQGFNHLGLPEQVRRARPVARELLIQGIDFGQRSFETEVARIYKLAGVPDPVDFLEPLLAEDQHVEASDAIWTALAAALALGIAVGQLLMANALEGGTQ